MNNSSSFKTNTSTAQRLPSTTAGRVSIGLALAFAALFAWVMFLDPLVGLFIGKETTGLTDSWVTPLVMVILVDAAAVAGVLARRAGERTVLAQVVMWISIVTGALWTLIVVGTFLADR